jgi:hypothetical protein
MVRIEPVIGHITTYVTGAHPVVQSRDHPIWTSESRQEANMIGSRGRALQKLRPDTVEMVQSSEKLFQNGLNLLWDKSQFSAPVRFLAKPICRLSHIELIPWLVPIIRLIESFRFRNSPDLDHTMSAFLHRPGLLSMRPDHHRNEARCAGVNSSDEPNSATSPLIGSKSWITVWRLFRGQYVVKPTGTPSKPRAVSVAKETTFAVCHSLTPSNGRPRLDLTR